MAPDVIVQRCKIWRPRWPCYGLTETLGKQPLSRNVWWIRVNTRLNGILRSGKRLRYSSTAAREFTLQKPYKKNATRSVYDCTVEDVVPVDHDTDKSLPHVTFATPAYVKHHRCEKPFYVSTDVDFCQSSQECPLVCLSFLPPAFQSSQKHLENNHCPAMSGEFE